MSNDNKTGAYNKKRSHAEIRMSKLKKISHAETVLLQIHKKIEQLQVRSSRITNRRDKLKQSVLRCDATFQKKQNSLHAPNGKQSGKEGHTPLTL